MTRVARLPGRPWNPTEPSCTQQITSAEVPAQLHLGTGWKRTAPAPRPRKSETMRLEQELLVEAQESLPSRAAWR